MGGDRLKIAIIEDDAGLNQAFLRVLQAAGFDASGFESAAAALADPGILQAACLVVDVHLPDMTGYELLQRLSSRGSLPPTIIATAHDNASSRRQALAMSAVSYLTKPFSGRVLLDAVKRAVKERQAMPH